MNNHRTDKQKIDQIPVSRSTADDVCQVLSEILSDGVDVHRCLAAQAFGRIGNPAAVQPLIAALLDEDEDVRTDAAGALSELADPRANQQLLENLLGDPCTEVKLAAIETLTKLGDRQVIPWLLRMLKGRDEEIVWDEEEFYSSGWDDWVDIQVKSVSALATLKAEEAVPDIVAAILDEDAQDMTEIAFKALARMGRPGTEALADFLDQEQTRLRRRAATALATIKTEEAEAPLARAFSDPSPEVRIAAMRTRAEVVPDDPRLAMFLEDSDVSIRAGAVGLVGKHLPDRIPEMLSDASASVQVAALKALAENTNIPVDQDLVTELRQKVSDETGEILVAAIHALAAVAPKVALDDLIVWLDHSKGDADAQRAALQALAVVGGERAVEVLVSRIDDEDRSIRLETMSALAKLARADEEWPNTAAQALLSALQGHFEPEPEEGADDQTAIAAEETIAENIEPEPEVALENAEDSSFPTSTLDALLSDVPEAREVLNFSDEGVELTPADMERLALAKRIKRKKRVSLVPKVILHEDICRFAARVLGDINQAEVACELAIALTHADKDVRSVAADSLARIGLHLQPLPAAASEAIVAATATASRDDKLRLFRALAACEGADIVDLLSAYLSDEDCFVRSEAITALSRLGRCGSEVIALLDDIDPAVRLSAAKAVAASGRDDAVKLLVEFSFTHEGYHGRQTAKLLRNMDTVQSTTLFTGVLRDPERKRIWPVAIEALAEINKSQLIQVKADMGRELIM